jgi:hypothetical protein
LKERTDRDAAKMKKKAKYETTKKYKKGLWKKAWHLWSLHIRLKYADEFGMASCYTCGKRLHYKQLQCGHFWHDRLDFEEDNHKPQCSSCNKYNAGKMGAVYAAKLLDELGEKRFKELRLLANTKRNDYSLAELHEIIAKFS